MSFIIAYTCIFDDLIMYKAYLHRNCIPLFNSIDFEEKQSHTHLLIGLAVWTREGYHKIARMIELPM